MTDCDEVFAFLDVPADRVRPFVPDRYTIQSAENGLAQLQITVRRCEETTVTEETSTDTKEGRVAVVIERPDGQSDLPYFCCDYYLLSWSTTDPNLAGWLKDNTGLGQVVHRVKHFPYAFGRELDPAPGLPGLDVNFGATVIKPPDWSFTVDGTVTRPSDDDMEFTVRFWTDVGGDTVLVTGYSDNERLGWANGTVTPAEGSKLAEIVGNESQDFAAPFSAGGFQSATWTITVNP